MSNTPKTLTTVQCHRLLDALRGTDETPNQIRCQIYTHPNEQDKHKAIENMDRSEGSPDPARY